MTSRFKTSCIAAITLGAAFSMTAGLALAADDNLSADQIVNALQAKPLSRSLSVDNRADPTAQAREDSFINSLRNRQSRSLSLGEREQIADLSATKRKIDFEIQFDYNSAKVRSASLPMVQELGKALSDPALKGSTFVIAGYTDAVGGDSFNQNLSERRADAIKQYLTEKYGIAGSNLVTVGYGKTRLKDPSEPTAPINRRVQVVNLNSQTASK
ncbi:OmpA family protein [Bradyrhizobium sp.]|uniref:OmpA family protein n=1 Tax=Bradyrhizobium sp. TaxID=376 RepID=UPI002D4476F1|nr:OmpA family protein [Bradyrhizobium sp.]HZR77552.1 OmpA family protein [Bradyrhizobium sp.]